MAKINRKLDRAEWAKLPADIQALYIERNGQYLLDADDAEVLYQQLEKAKGELTDAKRRLEAIRDVDPDEYQRLRDAAAKAARDKEIEQGNFEKLIAQDREAHAKAIAAREEAAVKLRAQLEESLVDGELTRSIAKYPGAKQTPLILGAKRFTRLMEINGKQRAVVVDEKGEPRLRPGAKTADDFMEPDDLVTEMRNDKEWAGNFPAASPRPVTTRTADMINRGQTTRTKETAESLADQVRGGASKVS